MKKTLLLLLAIFILFANADAQKKMTDREFANLKGQVKSVLNESAEAEIVNGKLEIDPRQRISEDLYDETGNLTQNVYVEGVSADIFSIAGGVKTQKSLNAGNAKLQNTTYLYDYDAQGRITEERKYDPSGVMFFKSVYKYNEKGQLKEETWYAKDRLTSDNFYTYDTQGNLIEKAYRILNTTYRFKDYKFDAQGNWTERTQFTSSELDGKQYLQTTIFYRKIQYY